MKKNEPDKYVTFYKGENNELSLLVKKSTSTTFNGEPIYYTMLGGRRFAYNSKLDKLYGIEIMVDKNISMVKLLGPKDIYVCKGDSVTNTIKEFPEFSKLGPLPDISNELAKMFITYTRIYTKYSEGGEKDDISYKLFTVTINDDTFILNEKAIIYARYTKIFGKDGEVCEYISPLKSHQSQFLRSLGLHYGSVYELLYTGLEVMQ